MWGSEVGVLTHHQIGSIVSEWVWTHQRKGEPIKVLKWGY